MKLSKAEIQCYGSLHHKSYQWNDGFYHFQNEQEGKEFYDFLKLMLYGENSETTEGVCGILWFSHGKEQYRLTRRFSLTEPYHELMSETTGAITDVSSGSLERVLGNLGEANYNNILSIGMLSGKNSKEMTADFMLQYQGYMDGMDPALDLGRAVQVLKMTRKGYQVQQEQRKKELSKLQNNLSTEISDASAELISIRKKRSELEETKGALRFGENGDQILDARIQQIKELQHRQNMLFFGVSFAVILAAILLFAVAGTSNPFSVIEILLLFSGGLTIYLGVRKNQEHEREIKRKQHLKRKWTNRHNRIGSEQAEAEEEFEDKARHYSNLKILYREYEEEKERITPEAEEAMAITEALQLIQNLSEQSNLERGRRMEERMTQIVREISGDSAWNFTYDGSHRLFAEHENQRVVLEKLDVSMIQVVYFALRMSVGEMFYRGQGEMYFLDNNYIKIKGIADWIKVNSSRHFIIYN